MEKLNARFLSRDDVPEPIDLCVIDVSFISLTLILPRAFELITPKGTILALIKPQFELRRENIGPGGIVADPELHQRAIESVKTAAAQLGLSLIGVKPSKLAGAEGNQEYFLHARKSD